MTLSREQKLMLLRIAVFALLLRLKKHGMAKDEDEGRFIYRQTENNNTVRIDTEKKQIAGGLGGKFDGEKVGMSTFFRTTF
jgi:hypothetical protein